MSSESNVIEDLWVQLARPFPPEAIGQKPKTNKSTGQVTYLDYIGHAEITERLNEVDPTWTWVPMSVADDGAPLVRENGTTLELWIELTVLGVTRPAVGTVDTGAWSGETAKELISDALRNAAMRFGVGLDLWKHRPNQNAGQARQYDPATTQHQWPENPPSNAAQDPAPGTQRTTRPPDGAAMSEGQSKNLYRLWHYKLNLDKAEYLERILLATGLEVEDDRGLSMRDAGKVISLLKEEAGEEADNRVFDPTPPPADDNLFANTEPF